MGWFFVLSVKFVPLNLQENSITKFSSVFLTTALTSERKPFSPPSESLKNVLNTFHSFYQRFSAVSIKKIMVSFLVPWLSSKMWSVLIKTLSKILSTVSQDLVKSIEWLLNNTILNTKSEVFKILSFKLPSLNFFVSWKDILTLLIKILLKFLSFLMITYAQKFLTIWKTVQTLYYSNVSNASWFWNQLTNLNKWSQMCSINSFL